MQILQDLALLKEHLCAEIVTDHRGKCDTITTYKGAPTINGMCVTCDTHTAKEGSSSPSRVTKNRLIAVMSIG